MIAVLTRRFQSGEQLTNDDRLNTPLAVNSANN
jgi:hypothetical protein